MIPNNNVSISEVEFETLKNLDTPGACFANFAYLEHSMEGSRPLPNIAIA
jgi:hypothetical protein